MLELNIALLILSQVIFFFITKNKKKLFKMLICQKQNKNYNITTF